MELKKMGLAVQDVADDGTFEGHAAVFGNVDSWKDVIEPGAFSETLQKSKSAGSFPAFLWQHNPDEPIGVWADMREDAKGLFVKGRLILDVVRAREAHSLLKAGALKGMSIGYRARNYSIDEATGIRTLKAIELFEASLVTFPANDKAVVTSVKTRPTTIRGFEAFLRDVGGFSANEAKRIASAGFKARDAQSQDTDQANQIIGEMVAKYSNGGKYA